MEVLVKVLREGVLVPEYANVGDAGCDLVAVETCTLTAGGGRALVATGLSVAIPEGYAGLVLPRSGLAIKHGVTCVNAPGLIDAGYRGELKVALVNLDPLIDYEIHPGDRVAQLVIMETTTASFRLVGTLPDSARGTGGFGSSGR